MTFKNRFERLGALEARLPFHVDDMDAVNRTFVRWASAKADRDLEVIEVWLYCFTQRYVLKRLMRESNVSPSEVEQHIERGFLRARQGLHRVTEPEHFTHWVRVVCRNTFLNGRRSSLPYTPIDENQVVDQQSMQPAYVDADYDRAVVYSTIEQAVERLPHALRPIAAMRLLDGHSYEYIAADTKRPLPTVRTYYHKALQRLREDPKVRALMFPFGEEATGTTALPEETPPPVPKGR